MRALRPTYCFEPWEVKTGGGTDFKVYSPFWRACQNSRPPREPIKAPEGIKLFEGEIGDETDLAAFDLGPKPLTGPVDFPSVSRRANRGGKDQLFDLSMSGLSITPICVIGQIIG